MGETEEMEDFTERLCVAALTWKKFYIPFLFIFGTVGNSLSILVFSSTPKYRRQSASYYLSALAVSDSVFLLQTLLYLLDEVFNGVVIPGLMCPLAGYLSSVARFMSVYLTVAFSIERFVAIHYPLLRPRLCTCSRARKIIAVLTLTALFLFSYLLVIFERHEVRDEKEELLLQNSSFSHEVPKNAEGLPIYYGKWRGKYICASQTKYDKFHDVCHILDTVFTFIIPFFMIAYFNLRIAISVRRQKKRGENLFEYNASTRRSPSVGNNEHLISKRMKIEETEKKEVKYPELQISQETRDESIKAAAGQDLRNPFSLDVVIPEERPDLLKNELENRDYRGSTLGQSLKRFSSTIKERMFSRRSTSSTNNNTSDARVTKMLLIISTVFLILNLPGHVWRCVKITLYFKGDSSNSSTAMNALGEWGLCLFITNFALNFILYCFSGSHFRKSLKNTLFQIFCKKIKKNSSTRG